MQIEVDELKKLIVAALDHVVADLGVTTFQLDGSEDFYWEVAAAEMWDMQNASPKIHVGSLMDDCEFAMRTAAAMAHGIPPDPYSLIHVAPLLRFVAENAGAVRS
ncbi:hypothetical protein ABIE56_002558 [Luteibacter sp. 621]|uniref:hypothetical protein n=1 Tax=Luteibacter sp. 621 TaxID=3373916 RepID=UPI003D1FF064